jgi:hypothetical protein
VLAGADLRGADLRGAELDAASLAGAIANPQTQWPDRFDRKAAGVVTDPTSEKHASGGPGSDETGHVGFSSEN